MAEESWLLDREKLDELSKSVRRLMAELQAKKEVKEMVEKEDCPICRLPLPYMVYTQVRDWNARVKALETKENIDRSECSELEFKLVSFAPMTDLKWAVELTAPTVKYVHKSCAEKMLGDRQERVYTFQWQKVYDDLALIVRRK